MSRIGITTTVPVELLIAAGHQPVDLNNVFISDPRPQRLIDIAERAGFPLNCCSWIKGIYAVCQEYGIDTVICVTTGDCSNTTMLMEVLKLEGITTVPFAFPEWPDSQQMEDTLKDLARHLDITLQAADGIRQQLRPVRDLVMTIDELTWQQGLVSGEENHRWLVSTSDFNGDYHHYRQELEAFLNQCRQRQPYPQDWLRLAYIGVPPVYGQDLYRYLESYGARVVFNEIQRQFAMPYPGNSLAEQYANYTYPYSTFERVSDITTELKRRQVDGVIHYVQAFCHRGIGDIIFRHTIDRPILTLEGNDEFYLNQHLKTRIEAFLDMLNRRRQSLK